MGLSVMKFWWHSAVIAIHSAVIAFVAWAVKEFAFFSFRERSRMRFHLYEHKSCDDDGDGRYVQGALMLMDKQWCQQEIVKQEQQ